MRICVKTQAELDAIPLDTKDFIYIDFGTKEKPAIVREQYWYIVGIINSSVIAAYNNSRVIANANSKVYAYDNSVVTTYSNSKVCAYDNSKVYAYDNSEVYAWDDSQVAAYGNSKVCARKDKNIVSINDNAIATSPSILCSGAELLNQCNGNIGNIKFAVSNVSDNKDYVFVNFCHIDDFCKRVFILTMRGVPYYCVYDFDTMSIEFYTMTFYRAFKNIADDTVFAYYLDNVLMPALVNTKFDKSAKLNII